MRALDSTGHHIGIAEQTLNFVINVCLRGPYAGQFGVGPQGVEGSVRPVRPPPALRRTLLHAAQADVGALAAGVPRPLSRDGQGERSER